MANITMEQTLRTPFVTGVFSRLKPAGLMFQNFYGLRPEASPTERVPHRQFNYDIFDNTRTMSKVRAPMVGPARTAPKKIGLGTGHCLRMYESISIPYEKVYNTRALGNSFGTIDATGQSYIARQQNYTAQRMANSVEFMISRMFRGGFSILIDGDDHYLREKDAGTVNVDFQIPSSHIDTVANVTGVSGDWSTAGTKIIDQLNELNKISERESGYAIHDFWINSSTYNGLIENNQLGDVRGTANRIFDTLNPTQVETADGPSRESGFSVTFGAMPLHRFHVYDGGLNVTTNVDSDDSGDFSLFIPDNRCIATPPPGVGEWNGLAISQEPIRENDESPVKLVEGLGAWSKATNDPPGEELRILHNITPILYIPKAVWYLTV